FLPTVSSIFFVLALPLPLISTLFPYTTLFRSRFRTVVVCAGGFGTSSYLTARLKNEVPYLDIVGIVSVTELKKWLSEQEHIDLRSEEHTSELQSRENLVCRLLLEKKNKIMKIV